MSAVSRTIKFMPPNAPSFPSQFTAAADTFRRRGSTFTLIFSSSWWLCSGCIMEFGKFSTVVQLFWGSSRRFTMYVHVKINDDVWDDLFCRRSVAGNIGRQITVPKFSIKTDSKLVRITIGEIYTEKGCNNEYKPKEMVQTSDLWTTPFELFEFLVYVMIFNSACALFQTKDQADTKALQKQNPYCIPGLMVHYACQHLDFSPYLHTSSFDGWTGKIPNPFGPTVHETAVNELL